ncbi:hypothetical protein N2W54_000156 [Lotmaria passim]
MSAASADAYASPPLHFFTAEEDADEEKEGLDAYFEACRASSSSSSSFSSLTSSSSLPFFSGQDTANRHEGQAHSTDSHAGNGSSHFAPLQGSAPRPLLLRQRHSRVSGMGEAGASAASAGSPLLRPTRTPQTPHTPHPMKQAATAAVRGVAGRNLADQLQHATLPLAPMNTMWQRSSDGNGTAPTDVFDFNLPTTSLSAKAKRKPAATSTTTTTTITTRGRSSRSPASSSPSLRERQTAQQCARQRAVLFDVLCALRQHATASCVDVVAGGEKDAETGKGNGSSTAGDSAAPPPASCSPPLNSAPVKKWRLTASLKSESQRQQWPTGFLGAVEQLLDVADDVAALEAHVRLLKQVCAMRDDGDDEKVGGAAAFSRMGAAPEEAQDATLALEQAGQQTLIRFSRVLSQLSADFVQWVLQVQQFLIVVCEAAVDPRSPQPDGSHPQSSCSSRWAAEEEQAAPRSAEGWSRRKCKTDEEMEEGMDETEVKEGRDRVLPSAYSLVNIVLAVQENSTPLRRCRVLIEESGCFDGLNEVLLLHKQQLQQQETTSAPEDGDSSSFSPAPPAPPSSTVSFAVLAARLLDTLIIQASAMQDTATMDLYRFYVMLLLYTAWPYVLLCTAAIFGFVRGIDPPVWRRQLPRLFRSSFSHVRVGDAHGRYPTDVLSLLLNCVGYYNSSEVFTTTTTYNSGSSASQRSRAGTVVEGGRSASLHQDMSERHVALAALASARGFVLRSLATFTRRKKQVALSRTPARPEHSTNNSTGAVAASSSAGQLKKARQENQNRVVVAGGGSGGRGSSRDGAAGDVSKGAPTVSWQQWRTKSVKEILHYIMYESGGAQDSANAGDGSGVDNYQADQVDYANSAGAAVVAYAQENQDVRRRVVQLPPHAPGCSTGHYLYYPTTIPLGFATMAAEALPGQRRWQQQQQRDREMEQAGAPVPSTTPLLPRRESAGGDDGSAEEDELDEESSNPLQRRALSLWTLLITESATAPDVRFVNALACVGDEEEEEDEDNVSSHRAFYRRYSTSASPNRLKRRHQLWINVTIPCARWVTAALLIPIGVAVQRLQERRLRDLLAVSLPAFHDGSGLLWSSNNDMEAESGTMGFGGASSIRSDRPTAFSSHVPPVGAAAELVPPHHNINYVSSFFSSPVAITNGACFFLHALKLVVDVALCRDQERLVYGFLERLYREPRWWSRRRVDGGAGAFEKFGTAAPAVSALFADALRGKRLGEFVRLVVLPANDARKERASADQKEADAAASPISTIANDMLDAFASFQLEFTFPSAFSLILQPKDLSVYVHPVTNTTERSYQTFFWQQRRRLCMEETPLAAPTPVHTSGPATLAAAKEKRGIAFADVWSYIFGYQCSLYYAQITLREHKKQLHQRDTQDFQVARTMGQPGPRVARHLQYVARGLGSAYYTLNFAVDTLLSFTQAEAMRAVYDLERLLHTAMRATPGLHSCMELCRELDTLLLQLHFIAFPARPAVALNARERGMQSSAMEAVRGAVQRLLAVALDPSRLPVSYMSSSTRNSVEALVAAVTVAEERQSVLASRLHALRVMLTFNKYYGTLEETLSYRFS